MMRAEFPELAELRVSVSDDVRDRQWAVIAETLSAVPESTGRSWRRRMVAWVAAAAAAGVPVSAVAAESSVPGDLLYPVKLAVEPLRAVLDEDVDVRHRVEELETVVDSEATDDEIALVLERAERAVQDTDDIDLARRVDRVRDRIDDGPSGEDSPREPVGPDPTTPPSDRPSDRPRDGDSRTDGDGAEITTTRPDREAPSDRQRRDETADGPSDDSGGRQSTATTPSDGTSTSTPAPSDGPVSTEEPRDSGPTDGARHDRP